MKKYILVAVDYVSKWVETEACATTDAHVVLNFLKKNIFNRFGTPRAIISDGGSHLCNKVFEKRLEKYGVMHKVSSPYHTQTSRQVEESNRESKEVKTVNTSKKDWCIRLDDALWAYHTAFVISQPEIYVLNITMTAQFIRQDLQMATTEDQYDPPPSTVQFPETDQFNPTFALIQVEPAPA
ncbi:uncharacterized protein [Henckelia pumila]|uniref:uncharacterized protein n=1 Tax=Henckelia pumila TaxID=405737 RepID=UPI003C6E1AF4